MRELAAKTHTDPFGRQITVARGTLDRWIRSWREGGFDALLPPTRQVTPRTPEEVLDLAAALKRENPSRTTAQVVRILTQHLGWGPSYRTVHRHLGRLKLLTRPDGQTPAAFGRFEADRPNELWVGDGLHDPKINGRKTYLFAFVDDCSRAWSGTAGAAPRTASAWPRPCGRRWPPAESPRASMSTTAPHSWLALRLTAGPPGQPLPLLARRAVLLALALHQRAEQAAQQLEEFLNLLQRGPR